MLTQSRIWVSAVKNMKISKLNFSIVIIGMAFMLILVTIYRLRAQENQQVFLPAIHANSFFANGQENEPNNNFEQANGPIQSGTDYIGLPNDSYDIFYFTLNEPGLITMQVTNHQVNSGQMLLFHEENGQIVTIGPRDDSPPNYQISYLADDIGTYFLFLFVDMAQPHQSDTPYSLNVTYPRATAVTATPSPNETPTSSPTSTATQLPTPTVFPSSTAAIPTLEATQIATNTTTPTTTPTTPTTTPTPLPTSTATATPLVPVGEPSLPAGYQFYDNFDGPSELPAKWHISGTNNLCDRDQVDGTLEMHCETNSNNAQLSFRPKDDSVNSADGIAVAVNVSSADWQSEFGLGLDIFADDTWLRRYTFELGYNSIELVEYYPDNNWQSVSLGIMAPITGSDPHVLQIEIESDNLAFYFDGAPVTLQNSPTLPPDISDRSWLFEGYILSTGGFLELDSTVFWSATR